ncbi:MAG: enoyl-CoA hydratase/isomerase family protein [Acidimicrobiales bacterium]
MAVDDARSGDRQGPFVAVERRHGVALVRLERPKKNALSTALLAQLGAAVQALADEDVGAVVLWGGDKLFAAGADVSEFTAPGAATLVAHSFHVATGAIAALEAPTIAAITGYALGGGLELALACDLRVVADDARLGQPEILLGIIPGGGATQRLPRLVGTARAKDMILTGRQVRAEEALRMGLADRVVPAAQVLDEALRLGAELAAGARRAQVAAKRLIDLSVSAPLAEGLHQEAAAFVSVFDTDDARHGIDSFLEHGPGRARFAGR